MADFPEELPGKKRKTPEKIPLKSTAGNRNPKTLLIQGTEASRAFPSFSPPQYSWERLFFRSGSGEGLSELVMEAPAVLRVSLKHANIPLGVHTCHLDLWVCIRYKRGWCFVWGFWRNVPFKKHHPQWMIIKTNNVQTLSYDSKDPLQSHFCLRSVVNVGVWFSSFFGGFSRGFLGPFSWKKQKNKSTTKNPPRNPRFERDFCWQNSSRGKFCLIQRSKLENWEIDILGVRKCTFGARCLEPFKWTFGAYSFSFSQATPFY